MYDALNKSAGPKDKERTSRAQDALLEAEARALALADLHQRDLDTQLSQLAEDQMLEQQIQELKVKHSPLHTPPLLPEGNPHSAALLSPQPRGKSPVQKKAEKTRTNEEKAQPTTAKTRKDRRSPELNKLLEQH